MVVNGVMVRNIACLMLCQVSREHTTKLLQSDVDESKVKSVVQGEDIEL